ncbi:MAG: hypothetical protein ACRDJX_08005 [Solirubrobacteraceae bacterium]
MPRIIVTADPVSSQSRASEHAPVLLDEQVRSVHLSTDHAAAQLVERLAWAVSDAERAEVQRATRSAGLHTRRSSRVPASRSGARRAVRTA